MPTVTTIFTAEDQTGSAISSARSGAIALRKEIDGTTDAYGSYEDQLRANAPTLRDAQRLNRLNTFAFKEQHEVLFTSIDLAGSVGRGFLKLANIFTAYNTMQTRVADQEERLAEAQENTREAIAKYGVNSKQAIDAKKREIKETQKLNKVNLEAQVQMIALGVAGLSMAHDLTAIAVQANKLKFALGSRGGLSAVLGGAGGAGILSGGLGGTPLITKGGATGFLSKIGRGSALRGAGAIAGAGIAAGFAANAFLNPAQTQQDKILNTLGTTGGLALTGFSLGGPIGAAIGAGAGLGLGLFQNFSDEFGNLFAGKGFVDNTAVDVNVSVNTAPGVIASASAEANRVLSMRSAIAGQVG